MKISILGSGWLGLPLAKDLIKRDYTINLSTRSVAKLKGLAETAATPYLIDIDNLSNESQAFLATEILIINITSKNKGGFAKFIEEIEKSKIKKVLFISSSSVYQVVNGIVNEDDGLTSADSLLHQIEQMFRSNTHFKTSVLRLSGLIGYSRHPGNFFKNGKVVQQPDAPVNLIHRDDCIGIINSIVEQEAWGTIFNGCAMTHPTKREFYSYARDLLDKPNPDFSSESDSGAYKIISNEKVIKQLSYQFIYPDVMAIKYD
ncbi:MAG: nucleoside-diphosphate-sugar epimerase [Methylophagaceae bacterium]|jgi:nucleoside-diphosphate-sugar epimerase